MRGVEDRSGQALIEMALVLPTFFLLLFGLFDFSIVLSGYGNATYAARVGARYASVHSSTSLDPCSTSSLTALVTPYLWTAPSGGVTVKPTYSGGNVVGGTVTISVQIVYPIGVPLLALTQVTVGSTAQRTILR